MSERNISPTKAIRLKCLDCCCEVSNQVKVCPSLDCPLWRFRLGLNPFTEKNKKNKLLQPKYMVELEDMSLNKAIEHITRKK